MQNKKSGKKADQYYQTESVGEGISYYKMVGEVYHSRRLKTKIHNLYLRALNKLKNQNKRQAKVLDIGCDIGTDLFMLPKVSNISVEKTGTDISKGAIAQARFFAHKRKENNTKFRVVDANQGQPFDNNSFDVVISSELIEHVEDPVAWLNEVYRILKPGGHAIVSTPNEKSFQKFVLHKLLPKKAESNMQNSRNTGFARHGGKGENFDFVDWDKEAHISVYGAVQWKRIVKQTNFEIEKFTGSSFYGGLPLFEKSPFVIGSMILLDSLIDKLPLHPHFQTCIIMDLEKSTK